MARTTPIPRSTGELVEAANGSGSEVAGNPNSGNYAFALGAYSGENDTLSQTIITTVGTNYAFTFYLKGDPGSSSTGIDFVAKWDGGTVLSLLSDTSSAYQEFTYIVAGTGSDTLSFAANDPLSTLTSIICPSRPWSPSRRHCCFLALVWQVEDGLPPARLNHGRVWSGGASKTFELIAVRYSAEEPSWSRPESTCAARILPASKTGRGFAYTPASRADCLWL